MLWADSRLAGMTTPLSGINFKGDDFKRLHTLGIHFNQQQGGAVGLRAAGLVEEGVAQAVGRQGRGLPIRTLQVFQRLQDVRVVSPDQIGAGICQGLRQGFLAAGGVSLVLGAPVQGDDHHIGGQGCLFHSLHGRLHLQRLADIIKGQQGQLQPIYLPDDRLKFRRYTRQTGRFQDLQRVCSSPSARQSS